MPRKQLLSRLVVTLLGVVVFATAAASIDSTSGIGDTDGPVSSDLTGVAVIADPLTEIVVGFLLLATLSGIWLLVSHPSDIAEVIAATLGLFLFSFALALLLYVVDPQLPFELPTDVVEDARLDQEQGPPDGADDPEGEPVEDDTDSSSESLFSFGQTIAAIAWLFAIIAGAIIVNARRTTPNVEDDDAVEEAAADDPAATTADKRAQLGAAAATAAEQIESADELDNEVYEAWVRMTRQLDGPDPATSTPGEFAAAAADAGMDRQDVEALTQLFEEVRYGDEPVTETRARRAQELFERIGTEYGPDEKPVEGDPQ